MAVFTKLNKNEIIEFIASYNLGHLDSFEEIIEGIENTNYKIHCNGSPYILTIFEKRININELPFFINLKNYLNENNFKCPKPIKDKKNNIINSIRNKKAIIISFIEGSKISLPKINHCNEIGKMVGNLHNLTKNFREKRKNSLGLKEWKLIFSKCIKNQNNSFNEVFENLRLELNYLEKNWPVNLPSGIIHADLFKDNIFFKDNKISGVIDFYFSCNNFFIYDLAIVINDWCFLDKDASININYFNAILEGYETHRKLDENEIESLNIILRAAAVRILVTRLYDYIYHPVDAVVVKKDPLQYYKILLWHQNNKTIIR
tara:strand:+ start:232 stop:1185 length:954 start_codon:yes stop_codon:yes gene_type:complete